MKGALLLCFTISFVSLALLGQTTNSQTSTATPETQAPKPAIQSQSTGSSNFASAKGFVLEDGSPVKLRINRTISSADVHAGDTVDFEVLEDISVNGTLVIPKGGLAFATVTEAQAKRQNGSWREA